MNIFILYNVCKIRTFLMKNQYLKDKYNHRRYDWM